MANRISRTETQDTDPRSTARGAIDADAAPLLETATGTSRSREGVPEEIADDAALEAAEAAAALDGGGADGKIAADFEGQPGYGETEDGLTDLEEATREQAEDREAGDGLDFRP